MEIIYKRFRGESMEFLQEKANLRGLGSESLPHANPKDPNL